MNIKSHTKNRRELKTADIITFLNAISGIAALALALLDKTIFAGIALLAAVVFDFLDGRVARATKTTELGKRLDSLSDMISFGMVPVAIAFAKSDINITLVLTATIFIIGGMYRLARYEVTHTTQKDVINMKRKGVKICQEYRGMPITINGIGTAVILLVSPQAYWSITFSAYFLVAAVLMISNFKVKKL